MRKEFESELARKVSGKRVSSKVWVVVALCAAVAVCGAAAVTAVAAGNGDMLQDQLKDGTGDNCTCDGDGICDNDADGDGICDYQEDCVCINDSDGDGICDNQE